MSFIPDPLAGLVSPDNLGGAVTDISNAVFGNGVHQIPQTAIVGSIVAIGSDKPFYFFETEVPQDLPLGGVHVRALHQLVGGQRTVDAFGPQPHDLEFSGELFSLNSMGIPLINYTQIPHTALERHQQLDDLKNLGGRLQFYFDKYKWDVFIADYKGVVHHENHVTYTLKLDIIADYNSATGASSFKQRKAAGQQIAGFLAPADGMLSQYVTYANNMTTLLNNIQVLTTPLLNLINNLTTNPGSVLINALPLVPGAPATLNLLASAQSVSNTLTTYINTTHPQLLLDFEAAKPYNTLDNDALTRILIPEATAAQRQLATTLLFFLNLQITPCMPAATALCANNGMQAKAALQNLLKQMNLLVAPITVPTVTVNNPDLFALAIKYYNNIEKWVIIAAANGLNTPRPTGLFKLKIPQDSMGTVPGLSSTVGLQ